MTKKNKIPGPITAQIRSFRWVLDHPLNRNRKIRAGAVWLAMQVRSHALRQQWAVPFIEETRLYIGKGLTSSNMQHFAGIADPDVMGFMLHFLRPGDLCIDVGANIGVMSVLAAGAAGARTVAIEPDAGSADALRRNIELNGLGDRVEIHRTAAGDRTGELSLTLGDGAANRAAVDADTKVQAVPCTTLDALLPSAEPTLIKIDVEGFETAVLQGAHEMLAKGSLQALVLELKNHGAAYGYDEAQLRADLRQRGFAEFSYDPFERRLIPLETLERRPPNTIFVRDVETAAERLRTAPTRSLGGGRSL